MQESEDLAKQAQQIQVEAVRYSALAKQRCQSRIRSSIAPPDVPEVGGILPVHSRRIDLQDLYQSGRKLNIQGRNVRLLYIRQMVGHRRHVDG